MPYTATIRQRGQLTIPDQVRGVLSWLQTGEVVGIDIDDNEVRIRPHSKVSRGMNWDDFLMKVQLARSFGGKRGNLSGMIVADRESH